MRLYSRSHMPSSNALAAFASTVPGVSVRTLVGFRWASIGAQLFTIGFIGIVLGYALPFGSTLAAIGAAAILNLGLSTLYARNILLEGGEAALHFAFDLLQIGTLIYLTGGLTNPFILLLLVPVTIAASQLTMRAAWALYTLALLIALALWRFAAPLPWGGVDAPLPESFRYAIFAALALGMLFLVLYAGRTSAEGRQRAAALVATEGALEREARLSALGALAAAAAHELGGPLGTITLVARELADELGNDPDFGDDIRLLEAEAKRARDILASIAQRAETEHPFQRMPLPALVQEVATAFDNPRVPVIVEVSEGTRHPDVTRSPELLHGFHNFIANAIRHARTKVTIRVEADDATALVTIADDGNGFPADMLGRLGEPFVGGPGGTESGGMGLGVFISITLLGRRGATILFRNGTLGGAEVEIRWPRAALHADDAADGGIVS
jgi:two-component system, sensor histidine kinase RegB